MADNMESNDIEDSGEDEFAGIHKKDIIKNLSEKKQLNFKHIKEPINVKKVKDKKIDYECERKLGLEDVKGAKQQPDQITHVKSHHNEKIEQNKVEKIERILDMQDDTKVEKLVDQIERHDNDVVMARPDLLVHTFDLKN